MNDNLQKFIKDLGALTELWLITYNLFVQQGVDSDMAIKHTKALVSTILTSNSEKKTEEES